MRLKTVSLIGLASFLIDSVKSGVIRERRKATDSVFPTEEVNS